MPVGRDVYFDTPLTNVAIRAFATADAGYVGGRLFPSVPVGKQSGRYYTIDKDTWLRVHNTRRAPKTRPNRIEFKVSSDGYYAENYALAAEIAREDLANSDNAIRLRENHTLNTVEGLLRDQEDRIAKLVTSISNVGSGVTLSGTNQWSDFVNSDPIADVTTAQAFIRQNTGLIPNTMVIDEDTYKVVRRHPSLLDLYKYTAGGQLTEGQLASTFGVANFWVATGIVNRALEGATASIVNIWGNNVLLARVVPGTSLETATLGLGFRWTPSGIPAPMQVVRYADPDPGKKVDVVESGYYQAEKIVAASLGYLIVSPI